MTRIAVLRERADGERRVAATPETVRKLIALGATVTVESGAGLAASIADEAYVAVGAASRESQVPTSSSPCRDRMQQRWLVLLPMHCCSAYSIR